ncbi:hypothetical protein GGH12_004184 [Coemansia sp. RSA 1822]|nr:hypothetical protein GGH12_004184 [Coemansia sp. RSA 1822]
MFMLHAVITKSWPEHNKTSHSILRIAWQTAHAEVQQNTDALDAPACAGVLRDLFLSGSPAVVGFATGLTTDLLRWLLICAYGSADMDGVGGDARSRVEAAHGWSQFAVHHIVPTDIGTTSSLRSHAEFLARYRSCLGESVLAIGTQQSGATINALVVGDGALDDLLALVQLAATLDMGPNAASSSQFLSFGSASEELSDHGDRDMDACLGVLICEALKLLAFLIHGSATYTARFTKIGGYSIVNTCITNISRRSPTASAAMCEGMLALLSGSIDPANCRTWRTLRIDHDWLPTMTALYSQLPLLECIAVLRFIAHWCEESRHARWWCAQSTFARQSIERLQMLLAEVSCAFAQPEDRQACIVAYTRYLGSMLAAVMGMSACAADLKLLLRTMVSGIDSGNVSSAALETGEAAKYTQLVRQALSLALIRCARESPSQSYFDFGGSPGALHAPYFRRVPEQGFTFTAWICPDQTAYLGEHHLLSVKLYDPISSVPSPGPEGNSQSAAALPLLLGNGSSLEVEVGTVIHLATGSDDNVVFAYNHLSEGLKLCITADGSQNTVHCADKLVSPGRWHSLALCYAPAKRGWSPFAASNVHVYVDGAQAYKGSLPFIDYSAYRSCFVGGFLDDEASGAISTDSSHDSASDDQKIQNPFTGRIAGIRMFDGLLRTSEIELLHHLGPAHASQLRKQQGLDLSVCASTLMQALDQPLAASLATSISKDIAGLFANGELGSSVSNQTMVSLYTPHDANKSQNNSEDRVRMEEASQPWQMRGHVLTVSTTTIHQLLSSVGGIESVLVLLYHLDWIGSAMPLARVGPLGSDERAFDQRMLERMPLPSFFYLLRDLVRGDPCMLGGIHSLNMVSLIARIIQKQPDLASHLTMATLRAMQAFQTALDTQGGCLPSVYADTSQFWSQVQRELVFNLRIWRRATAECQLLYLKEMQHLLCLGRTGDEQGKRCNASAGVCGKKPGDGSLGVRWILYTLFNYYPYDTSQHISQQHQQIQRARQRARSLSARPTTPATSGQGHTNSDDAVSSTKSNTVPPAGSLEAPSASAENDYNIDVEIPESDVPGFPPLLRTETKQLRRVLLRTLELFLTASNDQLLTDSLAAQSPPATRADVTHLVRHLLFTCNRDTEHTRELLQLLFRCLADGSPNANSLASKLLSAGGLDVLTHIIECDDDSMAAEAINIVVLLLAMSVATREHESTASRITNSLRGRVPVVVDTRRISRMLALIRTKKALTPALYRSLLLLTLRDHAALLASINIDSMPGEPAKSPPMRRVKHIRNLSIPQSLSSSVYLADDVAADAQESYVAPLPSRLVQDAAACSAILELACAPGTDPSVRVVVLRDICCLLEDEPANYERLGTPYLSLLSHLVSVVVICGYISEDSGDEASKSDDGTEDLKPGVNLPRLSDVYAKAMGHLELVPHTTLDYHTQSLAVGHIRARKAWVERRLDQLRRLTISSDAGSGDDMLLVQAQTELMLRTQEWSQAALHLIQMLVLHFFSVRSEYANKVHRMIVALWALTPTGSVPLAVRLLSLILSQAHDQLQSAPDMRQPQTSEWPLPHNLYLFALHALDMLFNYRQFQEYVAYHHEQLKALSASVSATTNIPSDERDGVYHSQHSPWDDMPELTRDLIEFMLELNRFGAYLRGPMCAHVLRLAVSGIRSMHLQRVKDSLHYLIRLLEQHPAQIDSTLASSSASIGCVCSGNCTIAQQTFAVLGYVHEAFMFAREQAGTETPRVYQRDEASSSSSYSDNVHAWESIGQQYMVILQCYRAHINSTCPQLRATAIFSGSDKVSLDWDQFVNFANSSEWQDLYRMQFMPAMRTMEEEEMRQASSSQSGFAAILRELLVHSHKAESRQVREARSAQTAVASSTLPIEADEASCVKAEGLNSSDGRWLSLWRQRLQALSAPRGPWRPMHRALQPVPAGSQQWILDMTENSQRMRRRLLKNASYEDHQVAANRRDRTGSRQKGKDKRQHSAPNESLSDDENVPHLSLSVPGADHVEGHGLDGDEEWNMITPEDLSVMTAASDPSATHFSIPGERIALLGCVYGRIELTQSLLRFAVERDSSGRACIRGSDTVPSSATTETSGDSTRQTANTDDMPRAMYAELSRDASWQLSDIQQIHFRRYMMRGSALEIFFRDRTSVLLNISNKKALMQLAWKLTSLPTANHQLALSDLRPPPVLMRRLELTERWQRGELSNFDYLMSLNTVAGRSYNDLSQYPVFPWVIRDYTSKWLDLQNPKTYRDLSRPMGALSEKRLRQFIERYESFEDPTGRIKKFHYGTHYSSAASVAYYLIRMEPFASVHISLQSGKFDHADRQFHSIADTWHSCTTSSGDVKELTPEFFYMPEFLINHNGLNLGQKQDGTRLNDVKLPPWATTPEEFIRINRQALESEHVSANLHKWIDLIFGFKQRGAEAAKAHNVFYYLTYEGAVNIDAVQDPLERASIESQINYFGQTPTQLFASPHPPRHVRTAQQLYSPLTTPISKVQQFVLQASSRDIAFVGSAQRVPSIQYGAAALISVPWPDRPTFQPKSVSSLPDHGGHDFGSKHAHPVAKEVLTIVDTAGRMSMYELALAAGDNGRLQLTMEPVLEGYYALAAANPPSRSQQLLRASSRPTSYAVVSCVPELLVTCAHLDSAIRFTRIAGGRDSGADGLQRAPLPSMVAATSRGMNMTNAYASAVVSAMSSRNDSAGVSSTPRPSKTESAIRPFAGLFGGSSSTSTSSKHRRRNADEAQDSCTSTSAAPSVFIPLAARLLDPINDSSCVYLSDQPSCVAVSDGGQCAAAGTEQGVVVILGIGFGVDSGDASSTAASALFEADYAVPGIGLPLLFATGLADPMNTNIGYTSMAALGRDASIPQGGTKAGRWVVRHVLHGHDAAVLDVAVNADHDIVASASSDGTVIMWTARTGQYLRTLVPAFIGGPSTDSSDIIPPAPRHSERYSRIERVQISAEALIVCYSVSGSIRASEYCDKMDPVRALNQSAQTMVGYESETPGSACGHVSNQDMHDSSQKSSGSSSSGGRSTRPTTGSGYIGEGAVEAGALHVYSINGRHLRTRRLVHHLRDMALTRDGKFGACVSLDSRVAVFDAHTLGVVRQFELPSCGCSVTWSGTSEQQLIVGCEGGRIVVISVDFFA